MAFNNLDRPIVDWLTYRSYEYNRKTFPGVPPNSWRLIFKDALVFEEIYDTAMKTTYRELHGIDYSTNDDRRTHDQ